MKKSYNAVIFAILTLLAVLGVGIWYQRTKAVDHTAQQNEAEAASAETEDKTSAPSGEAREEAADQLPESNEDMQVPGEDEQVPGGDGRTAGEDAQSPDGDAQTAGGDAGAAGEDGRTAGEDTQSPDGDAQAADDDTQGCESDAPSADGDAQSPEEDTSGSGTRTQFIFNPHLYSPTIGSVRGDEYWEGLYNLIDALRAGEDTFECASREVYLWCANPARLSDFYIPGVFALEDLFRLPEDAYKDGTGTIVYDMDKDEWREKAAAFEEDVMEVINEYVKPDYTDFEKCLALLDYITSTCVYDYNDDMWQGSFCQPLYEHSGICTNFGHYYAYLLRQCGVDAWPIENESFSRYPGFHCWTYAVVDGVGYQIDPTWLLRSDSYDGNLWLTYFMMTDQDRIDNGFDTSTFCLYAYPEIDAECTDDRFAPLHRGYYESIDRENKILYYNVDGVTEEFYYGWH